MAHLIYQERKSPVLSRPTLPCIARHYTINLTAGCLFGCKYCYAQGYRRNLGPGKVIFYHNSWSKLKTELQRKKTRPRIIYFSTACEPLAPFAEVHEDLYKIMELLLSNSIAVYLSTKAHIPDRFIQLFALHPGQVFVQVGITTVDDRIRKALEPHAAPVSIRLGNIRRLLRCGIFTEARLDPLIPSLTDREDSSRMLFQRFSELGLGRAVASYLFLRKSNRRPVERALGDLHHELHGYYSDKIDNYCSGSSIDIVARSYREQKYAMLAASAREYGISLQFCSCKNPGLTTNVCHPQGPSRENQSALF
jgi:DNA repair photolyase